MLGVGGVEQIAQHQRAVLHPGGIAGVSQHDNDAGRAVEGVAVGTHHGGVHTGKLIPGGLVPDGDHDGLLVVHGGGGVKSGLQHGVQQFVRHLLGAVLADAAAGFQKFTHKKYLLVIILLTALSSVPSE